MQKPGWYKLYVYGKEATKEWGDVVGGTMLVVLRRNPNFPELPPKGTPGGGDTEDEVMRGVSGMGPQRHSANADKPEESIRELEKSIAIDRQMYLPYDPLRQAGVDDRLPQRHQGQGGGRAQDRRALQGRGPLLRAPQRTQLRQQRKRLRRKGDETLLRIRSRASTRISR